MRPLLLCLFLSCTFYTIAQTNSYDKLDAYFDFLSENNQFMGSVVIEKQDSILYKHAVGYRDIDAQLPNNPQTVFRLGSISKVFTATMIFQLIEEGKINLSTTLAEYFPLIQNAETITIKQMLQHNSGLFDFTSDPSYGTYMFAEQSRDAILSQILKGTPAASPGEQVAYCNTNFVLLSYIIEDLDGMSYAESLKNRITSKLNAPTIAYGTDATTSNNEALSYMYTGEFWQASGETHMSIPTGAGAVVGNALDVNEFISTLLSTNTLLSDASRKTMLTTIGDGYGHGIFALPFSTVKAYGHGGSIDGFRTRIAFLPQRNISVSVLSNGLSTSMSDITDTLIAAILGEAIELPLLSDITIDSSKLGRYPGTFLTDALPLSLTITTKNDKVVFQASGQQAVMLTTESDTEFSFNGIGLTISFSKLKDGVYQELLLEQGGGSFIFKRQ